MVPMTVTELHDTGVKGSNVSSPKMKKKEKRIRRTGCFKKEYILNFLLAIVTELNVKSCNQTPVSKCLGHDYCCVNYIVIYYN